MGLDTKALGKPKAPKKGEPPKRQKANTVSVIEQNTRDISDKPKGVQFMIPPSTIDEFNREAAEVFGFTKGAKSQMFLKLWEEYKSSKT